MSTRKKFNMIKPIGSMLLVEKIEHGDKTTKTGLVISAAFTDNGPKQGKVIDMGDGEFNYKGDLIPILGIDIDDIIYYPEHSGTEIEDEEGNKYLLLSNKHVMAKKSNA